MTTTFLGVDLSLNGTGLAVHDPRLTGQSPADPRHVLTYTLASDKKLDMMDPRRWDQILDQILPFAYPQDVSDRVVVAVETTFPTIKGNSHDALVSLRSLLKYKLIREYDATWIDVTPGQLKIYATGHGGPKSDKKVVLAAVRARYGHLLQVANHNEADALTLLAMTLDAYGQPLVPVYDDYRRALKAITWPESPRYT